jgi:hypothetical protein
MSVWNKSDHVLRFEKVVIGIRGAYDRCAVSPCTHMHRDR